MATVWAAMGRDCVLGLCVITADDGDGDNDADDADDDDDVDDDGDGE